MADQIIEDGLTLTTPSGAEIQCTGVRYQEDADGNRSHHEYIFRSVAELTAEREAAEEAEKAEKAEKAAEAEANGESPEGESQISPEGSDEKTTPENSLPLN